MAIGKYASIVIAICVSYASISSRQEEYIAFIKKHIEAML